MHPNPAFRGEGRARHVAFARKRGFGTLAINGAASPVLAHIPFLLHPDGTSAEFHLIRSNPVARAATTEAVLAVSGPDAYISPDWYGADDQVPTWNYVAVHLRGRLEPLPQEALLDLLDRQSAHFEAQLTPKPPWTTAKMTPAVLERLMRAIRPFRLSIEDIDGTWKLNQNKDAAVRLAAAEHLEADAGADLPDLARYMREV